MLFFSSWRSLSMSIANELSLAPFVFFLVDVGVIGVIELYLEDNHNDSTPFRHQNNTPKKPLKKTICQ